MYHDFNILLYLGTILGHRRISDEVKELKIGILNSSSKVSPRLRKPEKAHIE